MDSFTMGRSKSREIKSSGLGLEREDRDGVNTEETLWSVIGMVRG